MSLNINRDSSDVQETKLNPAGQTRKRKIGKGLTGKNESYSVAQQRTSKYPNLIRQAKTLEKMGFKGFPEVGLEQFIFMSVKLNKQMNEPEKYVCPPLLHCKLLRGQMSLFFSLLHILELKIHLLNDVQ